MFLCWKLWIHQVTVKSTHSKHFCWTWIKHISSAPSRCLFPLHTRLGWNQRRQCETLQDPQAWQRGILHHYTSAVWHVTETRQALHRYVVCNAPRSLWFSLLIHYSSQSSITAPGIILKITLSHTHRSMPPCSSLYCLQWAPVFPREMNSGSF